MTPPLERIRIGTRGSALARWQAEHVAAALGRLPGAPTTELVLIKTEGDRIQDVPLSKVQGKAFFTKEIEEALLRDQVDVAVHSLKDLATSMPPGLTLGAVMEREDPRDALLCPLSKGLAPSGELPHGARVGTSSLRRRALLARWRPDLELAELRGNVPTRIRKLDEGDYDAIVLAAAGVKRLGLAHRISAYLPFESFLPAVSQGAVGVQIRADDAEVARWVEALGSSPHPGGHRRRAGLSQEAGGRLPGPGGSPWRRSPGECSHASRRRLLPGWPAGGGGGGHRGRRTRRAELGLELAEGLLSGRRAGDPGWDQGPAGPGAGSCRVKALSPGRAWPSPGGRAADGPLTRILERRGARVLDWGSIGFAPPDDLCPLCSALARIQDYDWICFSSPRAVEAVVTRVAEPAGGGEDRRGGALHRCGP